MKPGLNADGSLWTIAQWKEYAKGQLTLPALHSDPKLNSFIRRGMEGIIEADDSLDREQAKNLVQHMAASVMAETIKKKPIR